MTAWAIPCAYCGARVAVNLGHVQLAGRVTEIPLPRCESCHSKTALKVHALRAGQGRRWRAIEAERAAEHARLAAAAEAKADAWIAAALADPRCICAGRPPRAWWENSHSHGIRNPPRHQPACPCARAK